MNLVLDDALEVNLKKNTRTELGRLSPLVVYMIPSSLLGRILLKGDNISLIQDAP